MNATDLITLTPRDAEDLLYAIDGSLKVQRRFQFFLWSQGGLQGPVPHETLICAWGGIDKSCFKYEVFSRAVLDEHFTAGLADPIDGLLARLIGEWLRKERRPCIFTADRDDNNCPPALSAEFRRHGFQRVVAHGLRFKDGAGSFFVFINGASTFDLRDAYLVEMLMPHLHMTLHRVAEDDADESFVDAVTADTVLSGREIEVLGWVRAGKTNYDIAQILDLSPLTVKNHMQKILRKLKVTNRAQAVAKAIAMRIIQDRETA